MKNINFLISFDYFNFKDKKDKYSKNFKEQFICQIANEFNKELKQSNHNVNLLHINILGNNNKLLFYTGIESKIKSKMKQYENDIYDFSNRFLKKDYIIDKEIFYVKTKIGKGSNKEQQQYSLGSILLVINYKTTDFKIENKENSRFYILFPIKCGDFHK